MSKTDKIVLDLADMSIIYVALSKFRSACIKAKCNSDFLLLLDELLVKIKCSNCYSESLLSSLGCELG